MSADAAHPNPDVARRLARIYTLHTAAIDLRLGETPYDTLLSRLGNPHKRLPPVVHVAGTNGKGSVIAFMRACLEAAGRRVHTYTSPHLVTFNERIRVGGNVIDDATLISLHDRVEGAATGLPLTFFEFTTAMAFVAFSETPADVVLLETGLGGRLDCTNVVESPAVTIITKISFDHTEFLGNTLPLIAAEKAGIMKAGVPCVIAPQMDPAAVLPVFKNAAKNIGATLCIVGKDMAESLPLGYPPPNLVGVHQIENAATALAAIDILAARSGLSVPDGARKTGIAGAVWPGRLQRIVSGTVAAAMPDGWELWFDAAHNDSGAIALAAQLRRWKADKPDTPVHLVAGLAADKDTVAFFGALSACCDSLTLVDLPQARKPQTAAELARKSGTPGGVSLFQSVSDACKAVSATGPRGVICVAGSLYLYAGLTNS